MVIHFQIQGRRGSGSIGHVRFDILPIKFSNNDDWDITGLLDYPHNGNIYLVRTDNPRGKCVKVRSNYYLTPDDKLHSDPFKVELDGEWKPYKGVER